jgi:bacteriocin leader peptide (microcyclamide/patellamide family)
MDKQNLMPQAAQPVNRITTGQLPTELAELSEEALQMQGDHSSASVLPATGGRDINNQHDGRIGRDYREIILMGGVCSYDGEDAE